MSTEAFLKFTFLGNFPKGLALTFLWGKSMKVLKNDLNTLIPSHI